MSTERIIIIVEGQDKGANAVLDNLQKNLEGTDQAANKAASGGLDNLIKKVAGAAIVQQMGSAMLQFGADSIKAASDAEEAGSKFDTVFRENAPAARAELDAFAEAANRSGVEMMGMAANIQDTLVPMGIARDEAAGLSVDVVKLAADLGSFNNMPMDESLQRLQGTLVGSHENALAFGVVINENTLKAKLAENGWDSLTGAQLEAAKVQARLQLLYEGTTDAQGDAIRTSESLANQMAGLDAATLDLQVSLGNLLAPAAEFFVNIASEGAERLQMVTDGIANMQGAIQTQTQATIAANGTYEDYVNNLGILGGMTEFANNETLRWIPGINTLHGAAVLATNALGVMTEEEYANAQAAAVEAERIAAINAEMDPWMANMQGARAETEALTEATSEQTGAVTNLSAQIAMLTDDLDYEKATSDLLTDALESQGASTAEVMQRKIDLMVATGQLTEAEKLDLEKKVAEINTLQQLTDALANGMISWETYLEVVSDGVVTQQEANHAILQSIDALGILDDSLASDAAMWDEMEAVWSGVPAAVEPATGAVNDLAIAAEAAAGDYSLNFDVSVTGDPIPGGGGGGNGGNQPPTAFQSGGIVPGSFLEPVPAIVHGGEMILNPSQQERLFSLLDGGGATSTGSTGGGPVVNVYIDGRQIMEGILVEVAERGRFGRVSGLGGRVK